MSPAVRQIPTRYSPVRHSINSVRLACVKHAASVQSEPGSNSPVKVCVPEGTIFWVRRTEVLVTTYWMRDSGELKRPHNLLD